MRSSNYTSKYFEYLGKGLEETLCHIDGKDTPIDAFFDNLIAVVEKIKAEKGRLFFVGNGASAAFANHMALDWSKNGKIYATSLSDSALLTALSNDFSYEAAFVEFLRIQKITKKDVAVTISSSGNSTNIVHVLKYCKDIEIKTIGFSGLKPDNETRRLANYSLYVPRKTYGFVECIHQVFLHLWLDKFMEVYEWDRESFQNMNAKQFKL